MKKFLTLACFLLMSFAFVQAQSNNSNSGNSNGNGPSIQVSTNITWATAQRVLHKALTDLQGQSNMNFGQFLLRYIQGNVTITLIASNPPTNTTYRVTILGGGDIIVVLDE